MSNIVPLSEDQVVEIDRESLWPGLVKIHESVTAWRASLGGAAAGIQVGPFGTAERAAQHGYPEHFQFVRTRYERDGEPVPGCTNRLELDEDCHVKSYCH